MELRHLKEMSAYDSSRLSSMNQICGPAPTLLENNRISNQINAFRESASSAAADATSAEIEGVKVNPALQVGCPGFSLEDSRLESIRIAREWLERKAVPLAIKWGEWRAAHEGKDPEPHTVQGWKEALDRCSDEGKECSLEDLDDEIGDSWLLQEDFMCGSYAAKMEGNKKKTISEERIPF
jgi:hypothetical protein